MTFNVSITHSGEAEFFQSLPKGKKELKGG